MTMTLSLMYPQAAWTLRRRTGHVVTEVELVANFSKAQIPPASTCSHC